MSWHPRFSGGLQWSAVVALSFFVSSLTSTTRSSAAAPPVSGRLIVASAIGQAGTGTIKGRLVWGGDTPPPQGPAIAKGAAPKDPNVCAAAKPILSHDLEVDPQSKGVIYGFAFISRPKAANPEMVREIVGKKPVIELDQKNCDFVPHSVALHQDQVLGLKSSDPVGHNVRLTGFNNAGINQVLAPNGTLDVKLVAERLPMRVACDIHPWMHGNVMVFDHPFFAVTGKDGSFEIKGVPAGSQNLVVWQEKVGYVTPGGGRGTPINVSPNKITDVGEIKIDPAKVKP